MSTRIEIDDCLRRTKRFINVLHYAVQATSWAVLVCIVVVHLGDHSWTAHLALWGAMLVLMGMALMGTSCAVYFASLEVGIDEIQRNGNEVRDVAKQKGV